MNRPPSFKSRKSKGIGLSRLLSLVGPVKSSSVLRTICPPYRRCEKKHWLAFLFSLYLFSLCLTALYNAIPYNTEQSNLQF